MTQERADQGREGPRLLIADAVAASRKALATQLRGHVRDDTGAAPVTETDSLESALLTAPTGGPAPWDVVILVASTAAEADQAVARLAAQAGPKPGLVVLLPPGERPSRVWPAGVRRLDRPARLAALLAAVTEAHAHADAEVGTTPDPTAEPTGADRAELSAFALGPYICDPGQRTLTDRASGRAQSLTEKEAAILACLRAAGRTVARTALLSGVWGYDGRVTTHTLETHIHRLRRKIESDPRRPSLLLTDSGGYRLGELE